jgi:DNA-binding MarR family transcriptional regulator/GNAT superfamily N-acetyltransferase
MAVPVAAPSPAPVPAAASALDDVAELRAFNRFYTRHLGLLDAGLLDSAYSLTEARVLYELAQQTDLDLAELRGRVGIDAGYLSRIVGRFDGDGLLVRSRSATDGRRLVVGLTDQGRAAFAELDTRSQRQVAGLLARLDPGQQRRLRGAMAAVRSLLADPADDDDSAPADGAGLVIRSAGAGDFGWIIQRNGAIYAQEHGWDETYEALVARIVAEMLDARAQARGRIDLWVAELDGTRVGCVCCTARDATTAQLRLLLVEPSARGAGVGAALIDHCLGFARRAGYHRIMLWTNDVLVQARRLYERFGFTLDEEETHHSFGHDLVGQNWSRDL